MRRSSGRWQRGARGAGHRDLDAQRLARKASISTRSSVRKCASLSTRNVITSYSIHYTKLYEFSLLGGIAGYAIGYFLFESVEPWLHRMGYWPAYQEGKAWFDTWGVS